MTLDLFTKQPINKALNNIKSRIFIKLDTFRILFFSVIDNK